MNSYGLVLAGGGARGSYEIGVWKALRALNIPIAAVTGTSVGALNGAMIVQDDFKIAHSMWSSLAIKDVLNFQREIDSISDIYKYPMDILPAIKTAISSGGLDTTPLSNLIYSLIDEDKVRNSPIDFGLVTFSLTDLKAVEIFKEDIPQGQLIAYLLASACFPSFQPIEIDNKRFIDGGIYNNVPISLILDKNIKDIVVVDISNNGLPKNIDLTGLNIIHIEPSENLGGILDFNSEQSQLNIELGYLDALKAFDKVRGNSYYLTGLPEKHSNAFKIDVSHLETIYSLLGIDYDDEFLSVNKMIINKTYKTISKYMMEDIMKKKGAKASFITAMAEITANQFKIDRRHIYSLDELNKTILEKRNDILNMDEFNTYIDNLLLSISNIRESDIIDVIKKMPITIDFLPVFLANPKLSGEDITRLRRVVAMTIPSISISSIYIYMLMDNLSIK